MISGLMALVLWTHRSVGSLFECCGCFVKRRQFLKNPEGPTPAIQIRHIWSIRPVCDQNVYAKVIGLA